MISLSYNSGASAIVNSAACRPPCIASCIANCIANSIPPAENTGSHPCSWKKLWGQQLLCLLPYSVLWDSGY